MKFRRYEKTFLVYFFTIILILCFFICLFIFRMHFIRTYSQISSTVIKNDLVYCLVDSKGLKDIQKNKYLIIDRKKQLIRIEKIDKNVLKRNGRYYHSVTFKVFLSAGYKENDLVEILFFDKKINIYSMIRIVWRG